MLQDQLKLQRETAALSLNRIQQTALRKQKKLVRHSKNLQKELKEVELSRVTTHLEKADEKNKLLASEPKEKVQNVAQDSMLLTLSG